MLKMITIKKSTIALLLVGGVLVGVAGTQVVRAAFRVSYVNTGLFTLAPGEGASFHVSLDDNAGAPASRVLLVFYDRLGAEILSDSAVLSAGESATLELPPGDGGHYRAHARIIEPTLNLAGRRAVNGTVEVHQTIGNLTTVVRTICSVDDAAGQGRIPN